MPAMVHRNIKCPRCNTQGARELNVVEGEEHPIFVCSLCKHTWCEAGRTY